MFYSRRQFLKAVAGFTLALYSKPLFGALGIFLESRAIFDEGLNWVTVRSAETLCERIKRAGFNVFVPCIWHGRGTVWPSRFAPWDNHNQRVRGFDPLENLIKVAGKYEIEIHPWFTVALRQRDFLPQYYDRGTPYESFDVHREEFREFIESLIFEVVSNYPVQGINLDFMRAGGICSSPQCVEDYRRKTGRNLLLDSEIRRLPGTEMKDLINWQENAVTDIIRRVSQKAREINQQIIISVDAAPGNRLVQIEGQNSLKWADEGWVDVVYCMDYGYPPDFAKIKKLQLEMKRPEALVMLCGNYDEIGALRVVVPRNAGRVVEILKESRSIGTGNGLGLYLYSMLSDDQIQALEKELFHFSAKPFWSRAKYRL
ncbi:MAG: family 10 glycosylhydrolase [Nitrospiria bacterium]